MSESWESGGKEVTTSTVTFGKPSDFIKGVFTGKKPVKTMNGENVLYEVKGISGSFHEVDSKKNPIEPAKQVEAGAYYSIWGGKSDIDGLFAKSRLGDIIAIQFAEEVPSKVKGHAAFKKMRTLQFGTDPDYMGESSDMVDTTEATKEL